MQYVPPVGGSPNASYINANYAAGIPASSILGTALENPQREIMHVIETAGLTPSGTDLTQLYQAIQALLAANNKKALIINDATFATGVADGDPVRWDATNSRFALAMADGTSNDLAIGLADVTNSMVVLSGETRSGLVSGLTPGGRYFLSSTGTLSTVAAPDVVKMGIAKSATMFWVDIDQALSTQNNSENIVVTVNTDIACVSNATGDPTANYYNFGSSFEVNVPSSGVIQALFTGKISSTTFQGIRNVFCGIKIGSTPYFPYSIATGTTFGGTGNYFATTATPYAYNESDTWTIKGGYGYLPNAPAFMSIEAMGIPTGSQTIQPIVAIIAGATTITNTIKGSEVPSRIYYKFDAYI